MDKRSGRLTLKNFLKAKRALVSPESVGLPRGQRRRTPGLRREEVATLADVGITWYTWLEQGRPINPSADTLHRIAQALRLSATDEGYLFTLAELPQPKSVVAPAFRVTPEILTLLDSYAGPAFIMSAISDVLAVNAMMRRLYAPFLRENAVGGKFADNQLWQMFMNPAPRELYRDYETVARHLVALIRFNAASHQQEPRYQEVIETLNQASPEFRTMWNEQHTAPPTPFTASVAHPEYGDITFHSQRFKLVGEDGGMIVFQVPANSATREIFAKITTSSLPESVSRN